MQCPFCQEEVGSEDRLQIHCLVCTSAYAEPSAEPSTSRAPGVDSVVVRFRWVKSRPCFEREVHLISSLAGSVTLYWKEDEGLYESDTVSIPVGEHICQLAVGGDVVPTETFEVNEESDVIFIIIGEANFRYPIFDDSDGRARVGADDIRSDEEAAEPVDSHARHQPPLDMESRERLSDTSNEMSPLYRELLQHQLSHGEPSWVPGSGVQSPVMSETDLSALAGQQDGEPPILGTPIDHTAELMPGRETGSPSVDLSEDEEPPRLSTPPSHREEMLPRHDTESRPVDVSEDDEPPTLTTPPNHREELLPRRDAESQPVEVSESDGPPRLGTPPSHRDELPPGHKTEHRPVDLSGESDVLSLTDGGGAGVQSDNEAEDAIARPSTFSPVPSSHSEHDSRVSRDSPNRLPNEGKARQDFVVSPLIVEAILRQSPTPVTVNEENSTVPPSSSLQFTPGRDLDATNEVQPTEHTQSGSRASPLGSVLDTVTVPVTTEQDGLLADHGFTTPPQRHSPAGSVQSSSLFSSGLPSPIMSPRGPSQSDTGAPLVSRGSPPGSLHTQVQLPLRPQSLGGTIPATAGLLTTLGSPRGPLSGAEESPVSPVHRQSPTGSNHSSSVRPQGGIGMVDLPHRQDVSRHSSQRNTPLLSSHGGSAAVSPLVEHSASSHLNHQASEHSTPSLQSPRHRSSGGGSPTELLMETAHRQTTPQVSSHTGSAAPIPPALPSTGRRESEHSTSSADSPRHMTSVRGSPTELLLETAYRRGAGSEVASPPVVPSSQLHHRNSEKSTPSVHTPKHRTSGTERPSEFLAETPPRSGVPSHTNTTPVMPSTASRVNHRESEDITSFTHSSRHRTSGRGRSADQPALTSQGGSSRASTGQSPASSVHSRPVHSPPHVTSPPLPRESVIPSRGSAFAAVTGERGSFPEGPSSEAEVLRQERDTFARELRQRAAHYEAELRRVKARNEDLEQQILSIETVANLTKQDDVKLEAMEQTVLDLNTNLQKKDEQIRTLQESVRGLERTNQQLKDEQESLKTVNELRLEDMNRLNSDLQQQVSDLRRRNLELSRAHRARDEAKIIELQVTQNTLEQHVRRLEKENKNLQKQLKQAQQEIDTMKTITSRNGSRISKARSETDLSRKFDKYSAYDKHRYGDLEPVAKTVSFAMRGDSSGLGTTRFSSLDTDYTRSHDFGVSSPLIMNGYGSSRSDTKRAVGSSDLSVQDRLTHDPVSGRGTVPRHRGGSLGEESDLSDDLEHAPLPRWRTQSSESSSSSVVSWDHVYIANSPVSSLYQQHDRGTGRRRRPHSYHGAAGSLHDVYRDKDDHQSSQHSKSSPYSQSLRDVGRHSTSSSSYSSNSPLPTTTTYQSVPTKLFSKPFAPRSSSDIQLGMEVLVTRSRGQIGRGIVKYVGPIPGRHDTFIGIELGPGQEGKHDGSLNGQRLFSCKPNRGIFVSFNKVVMCYG